jgi:hypothetical protein
LVGRWPRPIPSTTLRSHNRAQVTFDKVAGIEEVKDEVIEIVDFLPWAAGHPLSP